MRVRFLKILITVEPGGKRSYSLAAQADVSATGGAWGGGQAVQISRKTAQALLGPHWAVAVDSGGEYWAGITVTMP